jgi:hypothetical protein
MSSSIGKKSGYAIYEAAEKAALAIKGRYRQLQVVVFDAKKRRHIELPKAAAASAGTSFRRSAVGGRQALTVDPTGKLHIPPQWQAAAAEIFERHLRTIIVIGDSAVTKTASAAI